MVDLGGEGDLYKVGEKTKDLRRRNACAVQEGRNACQRRGCAAQACRSRCSAARSRDPQPPAFLAVCRAPFRSATSVCRQWPALHSSTGPLTITACRFPRGNFTGSVVRKHA